MNVEDRTMTIRRVKFVGKWVEFWWAEIPAPENPFDDEPYHESDKATRLRDAAYAAGMDDEIDNHGYAGKKVTWENIHDTNAWHIKSVSL